MDLLDPELRPIPPQPGCEPSMQIYQDHRRVSNTWALLYQKSLEITIIIVCEAMENIYSV